MVGEVAIGSEAGVCFVGCVEGNDECMRVGVQTADSSVIRCQQPVALISQQWNLVTLVLWVRYLSTPSLSSVRLFTSHRLTCPSLSPARTDSLFRFGCTRTAVILDEHIFATSSSVTAILLSLALHLAGDSMFARFGIELCDVIEQFAVTTPIAERNGTLVYPHSIVLIAVRV